MGYQTVFEGKFSITPPLEPNQVAYLQKLVHTRRIKRNAKLTEKLKDPVRLAAGLPIGVDGEFYVGSTTDFGQEHLKDVIDYNQPPETQPGLWCQWLVSNDGESLAWDENEKFYEYIPWLDYMIKNFFAIWNREINGSVEWQGEKIGDCGVIKIKKNKIKVGKSKYHYVDYED